MNLSDLTTEDLEEELERRTSKRKCGYCKEKIFWSGTRWFTKNANNCTSNMIPGAHIPMSDTDND